MMKLDNEREIEKRDLNKLCDAKAIKREREIEPSRRKRRE